MASVVDTTVKHFHSGMVGAPVLSGTAGALAALLDACLVNGFDVKAATSLVVAGGVATLTFAGTHSAAVDTVILVAGSSIAALNGEQKVTALGANQVKFATAAADGTSAGGVTFKMAAANWVSPFTGTNLRTYKSADPAGTGMILRLDDTGTTSARVVGYEQMTDINTGTGAFPTAAQMSGGGYWAKSTLTTGAPVLWTLVTDGRKFILHTAPYSSGGSSFSGGATRGFGDDLGTRPGGDPYACSLSYSSSSSLSDVVGALDGTSDARHAMPRNYTGLGSAVVYGAYTYIGSSTAPSGQDSTLGAFPSPVDGGMRLSRKFFSSGSAAPRSDIPGLLHVPMSGVSSTFAYRNTVAGTGALVGRSLMALQPTPNPSVSGGSNHGISFADITGPWR